MDSSTERASQPAPQPQPPPPAFQTPEWETPTSPPKRKLFGGGRPLPFKLPAFASSKPPPPSSSSSPDDEEAAYAKELENGTLRHRTSSIRPGSVRSPTAPRSSLAARFDALLPPHRTYLFGLKRRRFLLLVVLPLTLLILLVFCLGLGLGLRRKKTQDLPLPTNTGGIFSGDLTYYSPGLGACGWTSSDDDDIGAVSHLVWDQLQTGTNPNTNPLCGRRIRVRRGDQSVDFTVVDRCEGCEATDLDLSPSVFRQVAQMAEGRVTGSWAWL